MNPRLFFVLILAFCNLLSAATYYVSNSGSNLAAGTNQTTPLATLSFAVTKLHSQDTLLLSRGDVFRDTLNCGSVSNPTIGAYGQNALPRPVVSGSVALTGWTVYKGSVWVASCPRKIEKLFANDTLMTLARYPDTGWLRPDTMTENADGSNTVITCSTLIGHAGNAAGYWNNAQIRWRHWSWWYETRHIHSYDGAGRLTLDGTSVIHIDPADGTRGWGFYIDNKFEELDAPGEWYYDATAAKVYFYPRNGADPNTILVEGACLANGITLAGGNVDNICLRHQTLHGISLSKTSIVTNCRFEGIGGDSGGSALSASWDIANSHVFNNVFANNLNIGISWYENSGRKGMSVLEHDTLLSTGSVPGYGGSGTWHAVGILVHLSSNVQVRYNYIDKTGYAGVLLGSDSNFVYCNIIKNAMFTLNDGGAIYTDCSRSFIHNNIIYDTKGDLTSSGPWYPLGQGIWLEFLGDYHTSVVQNNTVVRSGCNGIYLPNNFSDTVKNNVLFDNSAAQLCLDGQQTNSSTGRTANLPQNNVISANVCYATSTKEATLEFRPEYNYGTLSGNYFCDPNTDSVVSGYGTGNNYYTLYNYTLARWRSLYTWADATAKTDPVKRPAAMKPTNPYGKGFIFVNESPAQQAFSLGSIAYEDLDGNAVSGSINIDAFSSKILVCVDSAAAVKNRAAGDFPMTFRLTGARFFLNLARQGTVVLNVYDPAGRRVFHAENSNLAPGTHIFDLRHVAGIKGVLVGGIYICKCTVSGSGQRSQWSGIMDLVR